MPTIDIDELLRILPQLIRENDTVKGAIITALSGVVATHEDIERVIDEFDHRFEAMQQQMNERFEAIDRRFEASDKRFEALQQQMNERFEAMEDDIHELKKGQQRIEISFNRLESKRGNEIESAILELLRDVMQLEGIDPTKIRRETIVDSTGAIFYENYSSDIDVLMENGNVYVIEVKSSINRGEIDHYLQNVRLFELVSNRQVTQAYLVVLHIYPEIKKFAEDRGLKVIYGDLY